MNKRLTLRKRCRPGRTPCPNCDGVGLTWWIKMWRACLVCDGTGEDSR